MSQQLHNKRIDNDLNTAALQAKKKLKKNAQKFQKFRAQQLHNK